MTADSNHMGWRPVGPVRWVGRGREFGEIDRALASARGVVISPEVGAGDGIGAASLASEYATRRASEYEHVLHVHADTAVQLTCELARIAYDIVEDAGALKPAEAVRVLRRFLHERDDWLLVAYGVRNVHVVSALVEFDGGHVILVVGNDDVASRSGFGEVRIGPLDQRNVLDDIASRVPDELGAATEVARFVGNSPLGLALAESVVSLSGSTWSGLRDALASVQIEWLDEPTGTEVALALALDGLAKIRPAEMKLLCALSGFVPSVAPLACLERMGGALGSTIAADARGVSGLVDELVRWTLVRRVERRGGAESGIEVLRPVRRLLMRSLPPTSRRRWHERSIRFAGNLVRGGRGFALDALPIGVCAAKRSLAMRSIGEGPVLAVVERLNECGFGLAAEELLEDPKLDEVAAEDVGARLQRSRLRAEILLGRGDPTNAARECERALASVDGEQEVDDPAIDGEVAHVRLTLAIAQRRAGRLSEASETLASSLDAVEHDSATRVRGLVEFGRIEQLRGRWEAAASALQTAVESAARLEVEDPDLLLSAESARCALLLERRFPTAAAQFLDDLRSLVPGFVQRPEMLRVHAEAHARLGNLVVARDSMSRAIAFDEIRGREAGTDLAVDRAGLAFVLHLGGRHGEAIGLFRDALATLLDDSNVDPDVVSRIVARYCRSLLSVGEVDEARDVSKRALRIRSRRPLPPNSGLVECLEARAAAFVASGRPDRAVPLLRRAVKVVGDVAVDPVAAARPLQFELGTCLVASGRLVETDGLTRELVESERLAAAENPSSATLTAALCLRSRCDERMGRMEEAERGLEEVVERLDAAAASGDEELSGRLPGILRRLARVQRRHGRLAAARRSVDRSLERLTVAGEPESSIRFVRSRVELARLHAARREFDYARAILDDLGSPESPDVELRSLIEFERGGIEFLDGRGHRATTHFESALDLRRKVFGSRHPRLHECLVGIVESTVGSLPERAIEAARDAVRLHETLGSPDLVEHAEAVHWLGRALAAAGALGEAATTYEQFETLSREIHAANDTCLARPRGEYGVVLARLGRFDEARPVLEEAVRAHESENGSGSESPLEDCRIWLARTLSAMGCHDEAIEHVETAAGRRSRRAGAGDDELVEALEVQEEVLRAAGREASADDIRERIENLREQRENVLF